MPAYYAPAFATLDATILAAFGEGCTFHPAAGGSRAITAAVDDGKVTAYEEGTLWESHRLEVLVMRDPAHALYSGIDVIEVGDGFRRDTDPEDVVFSFQGEHVEVHDAAWKLAFVRKTPIERGARRQ